MTAIECADFGAQPLLHSWLDRLVALARPATGGSANRSGGARTEARLDAELRHAQKLALAGRLATGLVHDFNNALMVAGACLDLITETPNNTYIVRDQAHAASEAIRRASDLARRLANFGRPDDGTREQADLNEIVRSSAQLVGPVAQPLVEVSVCCPAHALPVRVDPAQIEQAILNLCLNARDAMPDGGTLHLTTRSAIRWISREGEGRGRTPVTYAVVEVSDTGTGIPRDLQSQIFEPFFTTKPAGTGSGLGLAMVRETALSHGGLVELTSDALGTAFRILLPLS
jgi:two-component system cell cycle sensor histidine kinase/response regulator CckA